MSNIKERYKLIEMLHQYAVTNYTIDVTYDNDDKYRYNSLTAMANAVLKRRKEMANAILDSKEIDVDQASQLLENINNDIKSILLL